MIKRVGTITDGDTKEFICKAADLPNLASLSCGTGSTAFTTDTEQLYLFDGTEWGEIGADE